MCAGLLLSLTAVSQALGITGSAIGRCVFHINHKAKSDHDMYSLKFSTFQLEFSPEFLDNSCYLCIWSFGKQMFMKPP